MLIAGVRTCLAAGAAVIAAGAVSLSPAGMTPAPERASEQAYSLAASSALLNVPVNAFNMLASMPAWEIQAMNRFADAMIGTGSWQVWGPTNVVGFDEWDPPKLASVVDMMMPIQPFSSVLGEQISWWAKANLPMNPACAASSGACPDLGAAVRGWLKVPASQLNDGYQFPVVTNPFTLQPTSWSGQYVKLDPGAALTALWDYLTAEPTGVQTVPIGDFFTVPLKAAKAIFDAYYPFVQNSEWFNPTTPFSWVFRALAPVLCPSCGPEPYDSPYLFENYPPRPAATGRIPAPAASAVAVTSPAPVANEVSTATAATAEPVGTVNDADALDQHTPARETTAAPAVEAQAPAVEVQAAAQDSTAAPVIDAQVPARDTADPASRSRQAGDDTPTSDRSTRATGRHHVRSGSGDRA